MQNLRSLQNLRALGRKSGGPLFDPSSISVNGEKILLQQLFTKLAPTPAGIVYDERKNKGSARPIQLGRAYLFDGTNDFVDYGSAGFTFLNDASVGWSEEFTFNPSSLTGIRVLFAKQLASTTFRGTATYTDGATLRFNVIVNTSSNELVVSPSGFVPVIGTNYAVSIVYNGNKLASGVTWVINGVAYTSTAIVTTLSSNDINSGTAFRMGSSTGSFFFSGKIWGLKLFDNLGALKFFAKCDEQSGIYSMDSSGNGNQGVITNATLGTFHSTQNVYSYQNEVGYRFGINRLSYSEEFANAIWLKNSGTTVSANTTIAPNGETTADSLSEGGAVTRHGTFTTLLATVSGQYSFSVYAKNRAGARYLRLGINGVGPLDLAYSDFDLVNGTISKVATNSGTFTGATSSISSEGNGWYRITITGNGTIQYTTIAISNVAAAPTGTDFGYVSYTGNTTDGFFIWGAQLVAGSAALDYFRTSNFLTSETGMFSPRNEASVTMSINGQSLQFSGQVPYNAALEQSNCATGDGINDLLTLPYTPTGVTNGGTAVPTITAMTITFTAGTIFNLVVNEGATVHTYPCAEGYGSVAYDVSGEGDHGTWTNVTLGTFWTKQNTYHRNIVSGFSRYDHATDPDILVPYLASGTPLSISTPSGYTKISDNPAGAYHNGAETLIDFTNNVLSPEAVRNSWETAWAFNSARTNPEFKRTLTSGGIDHRVDRFLAYRTALTGTNLSKVNKYVTTKAI